MMSAIPIASLIIEKIDDAKASPAAVTRPTETAEFSLEEWSTDSAANRDSPDTPAFGPDREPNILPAKPQTSKLNFERIADEQGFSRKAGVENANTRPGLLAQLSAGSRSIITAPDDPSGIGPEESLIDPRTGKAEPQAAPVSQKTPASERLQVSVRVEATVAEGLEEARATPETKHSQVQKVDELAKLTLEGVRATPQDSARLREQTSERPLVLSGPDIDTKDAAANIPIGETGQAQTALPKMQLDYRQKSGTNPIHSLLGGGWSAELTPGTSGGVQMADQRTSEKTNTRSAKAAIGNGAEETTRLVRPIGSQPAPVATSPDPFVTVGDVKIETGWIGRTQYAENNSVMEIRLSTGSQPQGIGFAQPPLRAEASGKAFGAQDKPPFPGVSSGFGNAPIERDLNVSAGGGEKSKQAGATRSDHRAVGMAPAVSVGVAGQDAGSGIAPSGAELVADLKGEGVHRSILALAEGVEFPSAVRSAPPGDATLRSGEIARNVSAQLAEGVKSTPTGIIEIRLSPDELGRVRLSLSPIDAGLAVNVMAERPETMEIIRRHIDVLAQDLRQQGHQNLTFHFGQNTKEGQARKEQNGEKPEDVARLKSIELASVVRTRALNLEQGRLDLRL